MEMKDSKAGRAEIISVQKINHLLEYPLTLGRYSYLLALLPALLLYLQVLKFDWTPLDEQWMIVQNADLATGNSTISKAFTQPIAARYYRPVLTLSIMLDHALGGLNPLVYHLSNLLYHLISVLILLKLLLAMKVPAARALFFSMLFSVHPLAVHAVAWVPGRNDILLCLFSLASLLFLLKYQEKISKKNLAMHLGAFAIALLTKENSVLLVLLFSWLSLPLLKAHSRTFFLLLFCWGLLLITYLLARNNIVHEFIFPSRGLWFQLSSNLSALLIYIGKLVMPLNLNIFPTLKNSSIVYGIITTAALFALIIKLRFNKPGYALAGLLVFLLMLVIPLAYSTNNGIGEQYEHRAYLPLAGIIIFFSQAKTAGREKMLILAGGAMFMIYCIITFQRTRLYRDEKIFVETGLKSAPDFYLFYQQKAEQLAVQGNSDSALIMINRAIKMRPDIAKMYNTRGYIYVNREKYGEAVADYSKAIALSEYNDYYYLNRFLAFNRQGDLRHAMQDLYYLKKKCGSILPRRESSDVINAWSSELEKLVALAEKKPEPGLLQTIACLFADIHLYEQALFYAAKAFRLEPSVPNRVLVDSLQRQYKNNPKPDFNF